MGFERGEADEVPRFGGGGAGAEELRGGIDSAHIQIERILDRRCAHARELLALHIREPEALRAEVGVDFAERLFAAIKRRETGLDFHAQQAVTAGGGYQARV